ncbi:MAG: hypothetical protein R3F29_02900 [Planctomycetota bacterium]
MSAELEHARRRARAGLWIGPGFFILSCIAVVVAAEVLAPGSKNFGRGLMMGAMMVSALLHVGSFLELVVVVKYLGHRPLPLAVLLLVGYWILLAGMVMVSVVS